MKNPDIGMDGFFAQFQADKTHYQGNPKMGGNYYGLSSASIYEHTDDMRAQQHRDHRGDKYLPDDGDIATKR